MDFKEKIEAIKALMGIKFEGAPAPIEQAAAEGAPTYENSATTKTGELDQWNGELAVGTELYCVTPTGIMPCEDGVEEFEDGTLVTVSQGKVTAITPAAENVAPEAGIGEDMAKKFNEDLESLKSEFTSAIDTLKQSTEQLHKENANLREAFSKTVELVELFNANPKTEEKPINAAFSKVAGKEARLLELAEAIKEISRNK